ncbi:MAG: thioredoxin family protein [Bdellovibrionales bacterium]
MALTYTPPGELGSACPEFKLKSVTGEWVTKSDFDDSEALVIGFICNHCPYVKAIEDRLIAASHDWSDLGVRFIGICSNDSTDHSEDRPEELLKRWHDKHYEFPYLIDEDQSVARSFGAVCTPDFFLYGPDRKLVYRGRLDDSWRDPSQVRAHELDDAVKAVLDKRPVNSVQKPSMGCSIKWK